MGVKRPRDFILTLEDDDVASQSESDDNDNENKKQKIEDTDLNPDFEFDGYGVLGGVKGIIKNKVMKTVNSIQELVLVLGVKSRSTIFKYMNLVKGFYSPNLKEIVNIRYPYIYNLLTHEIIHRKIKQKSALMIPNVSLFDLTLNLLYVYNSDFSLFCIYKSIVEAARLLNPNYNELGISLRGREIAIGRGKNKEELVYNELGSLYFAENPNTDR